MCGGLNFLVWDYFLQLSHSFESSDYTDLRKDSASLVGTKLLVADFNLEPWFTKLVWSKLLTRVHFSESGGRGRN